MPTAFVVTEVHPDAHPTANFFDVTHASAPNIRFEATYDAARSRVLVRGPVGFNNHVRLEDALDTEKNENSHGLVKRVTFGAYVAWLSQFGAKPEDQ